MNKFKIEIYDPKAKVWEDYSRYAVLPLKWANLLDEQLDEANVTLKKVPQEYFLPLRKVRVTLINSPDALFGGDEEIKSRAENNATITFNDRTKKISETLTINFVIANDNSIENPVGSGKFDHEIYLIELTKILEGFIGDSITFTNPLGNNYGG